MRSSLTLVTGPVKEPVSLAEVKGWAKIDTDADDQLLVTLIAATRGAAEEYLRRSLLTQTWKLTLDLGMSSLMDRLPAGVWEMPITAAYAEMPGSIDLPRGPVQSVSSVTTYDTSNAGTVYASSNYFVDAAGDRLILNPTAAWPSSLRAKAAAVIQYVTGYGDEPSNIPQPIRTAIMMHVQRLYDGRGQCDDADLAPGSKLLMDKFRRYG